MSCSLPSRIASLSLWVNLYPPERTRERIQLAALLGKSGRLSAITLLTKASPAPQESIQPRSSQRSTNRDE